MSTSSFSDRHIGPRDNQIQNMLSLFKLNNLDELVAESYPESILSKNQLDFGVGLTEEELLAEVDSIKVQNKLFKNYIGMGYNPTHTPQVILRNVLENPLWYTAYTPYQAEISQGRMEALLNFQSMIMDLTGFNLANASLLDEGTAAAEALNMCLNLQKKHIKTNNEKSVFIDSNIFPQTLELIKTRMAPLEVNVIVGDFSTFDFKNNKAFACLVQYPNATGEVINYEAFAKTAKNNGAMVVAVADILSLCILKPPAQWGADIAVGSSQRFGVPMGFGGPHAAFLATDEKYKRTVPGRIIGVSKDSLGNPALRLALQTREQHIRREKATSNICTSQVLLAVIASMYAVYHGPKGLKQIAKRTHNLTALLNELLEKDGLSSNHQSFYDTLSFNLDKKDISKITDRANKEKVNLGLWAGTVQVSLNETTTLKDIAQLYFVFTGKTISENTLTEKDTVSYDKALVRKSEYLTDPVFNSHYSETQMLRYITHLQSKDITLANSMIPLGSCTMKLNATSELKYLTDPHFSNMHPFAPADQTTGYLKIIKELEFQLGEITGMPGVSLQPNAGSQGEYSGLLVIKKYQKAQNQGHRNICIIPSSAHGTNPASAILAGLQVVIVGCDDNGNIHMEDLKAKAKKHKDNLCALMITYPSTHGVFEEGIVDICKTIHDNGGQVYMDGANLNALVGISKPGEFGADVIHINLHKTFAIPHGGGGPGVGPITCMKHLQPYLPTHGVVPSCGPKEGISAVSSAPWGSASILPISWSYIKMLGSDGLKKSTQVAVLNANYIAKKLSKHFKILYTGKNNYVAHECIIDLRPFKDNVGITIDDIAKRLMDYGFHSPTMSWPVSGTLMIEPTESESQEEIDRFCEAMIEIKKEIEEVEKGEYPKDNNVLINAPHTNDLLIENPWDKPYSAKKAYYPLPWIKKNKYWVPVGRIDNAYGDKHLICSCAPLSEY